MPVICVTASLPTIAVLLHPQSFAAAQPPTVDPLAAELERSLVQDVRPLVTTYCFECHAGDKVKGDIRLDAINGLTDAIAASDDLAMVREMLVTHEMPPKDKPKPSEHERLILVQWLESVLKFVPTDARPDPGWFTIHRLNRAEYRNTLRDLLGIDPHDIDIAERLPRDDTGYGFDNNADVLTTSPLALEQYLDAAERAIEYALGPIVETGDTPRPVAPLRVSSGGNTLPRGGIHLYSNGAALGTFEFPATGDYLIRVSAWENHAGDENARLSLRLNGNEVKSFAISGTESDPEEVEIRVRVTAGSRTIAAHFTNDYWKPNVADRNLAVEWITVAGPLEESTTERRKAWRDIFAVTDEAQPDQLRANTILERFATRAYRRPIDSAERESIAHLYNSLRGQGQAFENAVRLSLTAILVSPNFLFRSLDNPNSREPSTLYRLNAFELASRLSYFLWSSMPDESLLQLARNGSLTEDDTLRKEVRRMLDDPRSDAFIQNFAGQWLQLRTLDTLAIDNSRFPQYDEQLRADMVTEATLFFSDVVRGGGSILSLVSSDYSFLNERLAGFYDVEGVHGQEFRRVLLPASVHRGGVLTMGGVLTVTSNTTRTSPVKRGLFVLDQILGTPPPPPPADIPPLEQAAITAPDATLRERLAAHVANPTCAVCHNRLDPIGLAFENYDAIGHWRTEDGGKAIDSSGTLPGGQTFAGASDLKAMFLARGEQFVETLSAKVLTYAIGRGLEPFDRPAVREISIRVRDKGNRLDSLIEAVVLSNTFRTCRGREQRNE